MKWSVHPAKKTPRKTFLALSFIVIFMFAVGFIYGVFWAILGVLILFFSLHSYFFPTRYEVDEGKVLIKNIFGTQRRSLSEFKKVYKGKNGILLSPFRRKTFLNNFRGIFLFLPDDRTGIEDYLIGRIQEINNVGEAPAKDPDGSKPGV